MKIFYYIQGHEAASRGTPRGHRQVRRAPDLHQELAARVRGPHRLAGGAPRRRQWSSHGNTAAAPGLAASDDRRSGGRGNAQETGRRTPELPRRAGGEAPELAGFPQRPPRPQQRVAQQRGGE